MLDELLEEIKKLNYQDRLKILNDNNKVNQLLLLDKKENLLNFKKIVNLYEVKDLIKIFTKDIIDKIKKIHSGSESIYLEALKDKNSSEFEDGLRNNNDLMELLLTKGTYVRLNFSYDFVIDIIKYLDNNNIDYNKTCLFSILHSSLNEKTLQEKFLNENIKSIYKSKVLKFFNDDIVNNYIKNHIIYISNKDLYDIIQFKNIHINPSIYENKNFFKECLIKNTLYETRIDLEKLGNIIDTSYFEKLLKKEEIKILSLYNKELDIIDYKNSNTLFKDYLDNNKTETKKIILEFTIDYLFQDSSHNVYLNLIELLDYSLNDNIINRERLTFYKELLLIYKSETSDILSFFNKYKDIYKSSFFYDDLRLLKNDSYNKLKDSCLKINDITNLKNIELSNKYDIEIYELNGEPFNMLVSCTYTIPKGFNNSPRNCYTYIGEENMQVIYKDTYIYGYNNFNIENIMHVYEDDAYSLDLEKNTTSYVNRIRSKDELLKTNYRSEIQIKNNKIEDKLYDQLMPSYVICFDKVNEKSINAAKKLNIPIIIINRQKYKSLDKLNPLVNYEEEYTLLPYMTSSALEKRTTRGK